MRDDSGRAIPEKQSYESSDCSSSHRRDKAAPNAGTSAIANLSLHQLEAIGFSGRALRIDRLTQILAQDFVGGVARQAVHRQIGTGLLVAGKRACPAMGIEFLPAHTGCGERHAASRIAGCVTRSASTSSG